MNFLLTKKHILLYGMLIAIGLLRLFPHPPNLTPVVALSVLAAAWFPKGKMQYLIPIAIMLVTDLFIGLHNLMPVVYGSLLLAGACGRLLRNQINTKHVFLASTSASIVFFTVSNFGVWVMSSVYPKTLSGLISCYVMAIPFFHNTLIATTIVVLGSSLVVKYFNLLNYKSIANEV